MDSPFSLVHIIRGKNFEMLLHILCNSMSSFECLKYTQRNQAERWGAKKAQVSFIFVRAIFSSDLSHLGGVDMWGSVDVSNHMVDEYNLLHQVHVSQWQKTVKQILACLSRFSLLLRFVSRNSVNYLPTANSFWEWKLKLVINILWHVGKKSPLCWKMWDIRDMNSVWGVVTEEEAGECIVELAIPFCFCQVLKKSKTWWVIELLKTKVNVVYTWKTRFFCWMRVTESNIADRK